MKTGINWTLNQGKYNHARNDWKGTEYENDSRFISRFPMMTGDISLDYTPGSWTFSMTGSLQGKMYIDYYAVQLQDSQAAWQRVHGIYWKQEHIWIYTG